MKISNSKKELARIISENGGWSDGAEFAAQDKDGNVFKFDSKPVMGASREVWMPAGNGRTDKLCYCATIKGWHQTILSRAEYFRLYPAPDADGWIEHDGKHEPEISTSGLTIWCKWSDGLEQSHEANMVDWIDDSDVRVVAYRLHKQEQAKPQFCESVMRSSPEPDEQVWTNPPTIEQLAADYHNAKDYADRKQQEADAAKVDADARLKALEIAGEALGLLVSPITAKQEPELVITNRSQLELGDVIWLSDSTVKENNELTPSGEYTVVKVGAIGVESDGQTIYPDFSTREWRFIRRP